MNAFCLAGHAPSTPLLTVTGQPPFGLEAPPGLPTYPPPGFTGSSHLLSLLREPPTMLPLPTMTAQPATCSGQPPAPAAPAHCVPPEMMQVPCDSMSRPPPIRGGARGRGKKSRPPTMGAPNSSDHARMAPEPTPSEVQALIDANYEFINGQKARSTLQKTDRDLKRFKDFCEKAGAGREPEKLSAQVLCAHIATYIRTLTRLDGSDYEPGSITSAHSSIERYLREKGYPYSIMGAPEFQMSRDVVEAKRTLLKKSGKGNKPNAQTALTEDEINQLWEEGGFGTGSPVEIVAAVWWLFVTHFGLRASHECLQLEVGDITKHQDNLGNWYLQMNERITKTRRSEGNRSFAPKAWATNDERCPVAFYNLYMSLRPKAMMEPDSPFFLNVNHHPKPGNTARFISGPMGHNTLGRILRFAGVRAKIERPLTNHAGRKTSITTLHNAGIDDALIASHSGHKSLEAVRQYYKPNLEDQRRMGKALGKSMGKSAIADKEPRDAHPRPAHPAQQPAAALGRAPSPPPEPEPEPEPEPARHHVFRLPAPARPDVRPADTPEDTPEVSATPISHDKHVNENMSKMSRHVVIPWLESGLKTKKTG